MDRPRGQFEKVHEEVKERLDTVPVIGLPRVAGAFGLVHQRVPSEVDVAR
ncbi:hypothetical protein PV646_30840 [Streptomyces sp. ID05-26A]|nr:hypothetical protein [Streptomyces sp. ID05-26A]